MIETMRCRGRNGDADLSVYPSHRKAVGKDGRYRQEGYNFTMRNELKDLDYINVKCDVKNKKITILKAKTNEGRKVSQRREGQSGRYVQYQVSALPKGINKLIGDYKIGEKLENGYVLVPYEAEMSSKPKAYIKKDISNAKTHEELKAIEAHEMHVKFKSTEQLKDAMELIREIFNRDNAEIEFIDFKALVKEKESDTELIKKKKEVCKSVLEAWGVNHESAG